MARRRDDMRLLLATGGAVVVAGLLVAALLLFATGRGGRSTTLRQFTAGSATTIARLLRDGGPYFYADPFGHDRGFWFALEHGQIVALEQHLPGRSNCPVQWRGRVDSFVDCHDAKVRSDQLARYHTSIGKGETDKGALLVDLRRLEPPPLR